MAARTITTPDGRIISYSASSATSTPTTLPEQALGALQPFADACRAVLPDTSRSGGVRLGFFLFLLGAADRLWQLYGLDDRRFPEFAACLLQAHGVPASSATTLAYDLPQLREVEHARAILLEGADVFAQWTESHDADAVLRITQLAPGWQALDSALGRHR